MLIGYARVSTKDQNLDRQLDALKDVGCEKIFVDKVSGRVDNPAELTKAKEHLRKGDTLVVTSLSRLGRSLKSLIVEVNELKANGVGFRSLKEAIDTSSATGKLIFHVFGALAEFEADLISERTKAGLASARARVRLGGRPKKIANPKKLKRIQQMYNSKEMTVKEICEWAGISRGTLYNYLNNPK